MLIRLSEQKERSLYASGLGGDANSDAGTKTPSRDFDSPAPQGIRCLGPPYAISADLSAADSLRRNYAASDYTRSPTPPVTSSFQAVNTMSKPLAPKSFPTELLDEKEPQQSRVPSPSVGTPQAAAVLPKKGSGRGNRTTNNHHHHPPLLPNLVHTSPPAPDISPDGLYLQSHLPTSPYQLQTRNRPLTSHQKAVSDYRRVRINQIIDTGIRRRHITAKRQRQEEGILLRAWKRIRMLPSGWDSEDEGPADKGKEDAKDKDKDDGTSGKGRSKDEEKAAAALRRAAGGVRILGGFALPLTDKELEQEKQRPLNSVANVARDDVGEEALYFSRAFSLGVVQLESEETAAGEGRLLLPSPPLKPVDDLEDERELQAMDELAATIVKPRQGRKSRGGGGGTSRKSRGGASKKAREAKEETPADSRLSITRADHDAEDEDMHDEGDVTIGPSAELDDDERELLGEADTEEEEDEDDNMDEDP
jgi:Ino eighty subunit 1